MPQSNGLHDIFMSNMIWWWWWWLLDNIICTYYKRFLPYMISQSIIVILQLLFLSSLHRVDQIGLCLIL